MNQTKTNKISRLYDLVADDQAISDTIYALGKAHDNGNMTLNSFTKVSILYNCSFDMKRSY